MCGYQLEHNRVHRTADRETVCPDKSLLAAGQCILMIIINIIRFRVHSHISMAMSLSALSTLTSSAVLVHPLRNVNGFT